jgi:NAD-dependent SIR2 family protein deacetylase
MGANASKPNEEEAAKLKDSFDLPVYSDIANVKAYYDLGLTYRTICTPNWILDDPELFYGFWGKCFNDYRKTIPHEGYTIVKSWRDRYFSDNSIYAKRLEEIQKETIRNAGCFHPLYSRIAYEEKLQMQMQNIGRTQSQFQKYQSHKDDLPLASPFFVYTSNVDAHSVRAGFSPNEVYEIHGTTEMWQCASVCQDDVWLAPPHFLFNNIDPHTMRLIPTQQPETEMEREVSGPFSETNGFITGSFPRCRNCGGPARPAILMFGDSKFNADRAAAAQYKVWSEAVSSILEDNPDAKLLIFEVGCGLNVPTVRYQSETWLSDRRNVKLVRVNVDYPLRPCRAQTISLMGTGLHAVKMIDKFLKELEQLEQEKEQETVDAEARASVSTQPVSVEALSGGHVNTAG